MLRQHPLKNNVVAIIWSYTELLQGLFSVDSNCKYILLEMTGGNLLVKRDTRILELGHTY